MCVCVGSVSSFRAAFIRHYLLHFRVHVGGSILVACPAWFPRWIDAFPSFPLSFGLQHLWIVVILASYQLRDRIRGFFGVLMPFRCLLHFCLCLCARIFGINSAELTDPSLPDTAAEQRTKQSRMCGTCIKYAAGNEAGNEGRRMLQVGI